MSTTETQTVAAPDLPSLHLNAEKIYGDWRDDLCKNGYYVFKGAISQDKAKNYYQKKALDWLQSFDNGFSLEDKSRKGLFILFPEGTGRYSD
jgi:hypothetical protein